MPRPRVPLGLGALDHENLEFSGCPEDQRNGCLRVTVKWLGLAPMLWLAGETFNESTQPSIWDFHSNAPGVRIPYMFVKLCLESDGESVLEDPVGQIEEIADAPNR